MIKNYFKFANTLLTALLLTSCAVGPNYKRPVVNVPPKYKEAPPKGWKKAEPQDAFNRGQWWKIFRDKKLNHLEDQLNQSNQTIATAYENYQQAMALVDEARASYFPTLSATASITRHGGGSGGSFSSTTNSTPNASSNSSSSSISTGTFSSSSGGNGSTGNSHSLAFNAAWEPDIWGLVRRTVEAAQGGADASGALLASTRLASQGSLAQIYFQVRALDKDQVILDATVVDYKKALKLTENQYASGVAAQADIVQARTQLESAEALAINNKISRGQFEHAIAVLVGVPPAEFSLPPQPLSSPPPKIPGSVPSTLLERRPDVAQAEHLMIQANANIGVAIAAYFPTLTLSGNASYQHQGLINNWFSVPGLGWSIGPQLAETIFDGGLRSATVAAARAGYRSTVASYRQTILAAFQDVEDNLISLRTLRRQAVADEAAAKDARLALQLVINQYKAGTVDYSAVITAQTTAYTAEKTAADVVGLEMTSAVGLIKALGGGWNGSFC